LCVETSVEIGLSGHHQQASAFSLSLVAIPTIVNPVTKPAFFPSNALDHSDQNATANHSHSDTTIPAESYDR
jgi:hypothetical protein